MYPDTKLGFVGGNRINGSIWPRLKLLHGMGVPWREAGVAAATMSECRAAHNEAVLLRLAACLAPLLQPAVDALGRMPSIHT